MVQKPLCGRKPAFMIRFDSGHLAGRMSTDILTATDSTGALKEGGGSLDILVDGLTGAVAAWVCAALKDPHRARLL